MKSLKYKLKLSTNQKLILNTLSNEHRLLYNFCLDKAKNNCSFKELNEHTKSFRKVNQLTIKAKPAQNTIRTLIANIKSFYSRRLKDKTAKFPYKFKSWKHFTTFTLDCNNGCGGFKLKNDKLILSLIDKKHNLSIPINAEVLKHFNINKDSIKTITFKKVKECYFVIFVYKEQKKECALDKQNFVSIDLGVSNIATCFSNKIDNLSIKNNRFLNLEKRIENVQSQRDRKKKFSNSWKKLNKVFLRLKNRLTNKNKDFQHKASTKLIDLCLENDIGTLVIGDIKTKKLVHKHAKKLNKSTQNNGTLGRFKTFLSYKAKNAKIDFIKVNEAFTSQINCLTRKREFKSDLHIRKVKLHEMLLIDRDLNSAVNIAFRATEIKGEWLSQVEVLLNRTLHKMMLNEKSELIVLESFSSIEQTL